MLQSYATTVPCIVIRSSCGTTAGGFTDGSSTAGRDCDHAGTKPKSNAKTMAERIEVFIAMCDCFVSLHRAEGFSLGLAGAMLMGKPVIGTNYSGNLAFMNRENSLLVDFELVEIAENGYVYKKGFRWAEPSEAHAAELMRSVFEKRHEHKVRAERAKKGIAEQFSVEKAGERMKWRLEEVRNCDTTRAR